MQIIDDLIFSFGTVLPVFFLVLVGYYVRRKGVVDEHFTEQVSRLIFNYALPAKLFADVVTGDYSSLNVRFLAVILGGTTFIFILAWVLAARLFKDPDIKSVAIHGAYRGNVVYIGMPIMDNLLGRSDFTCMILIMSFGLTLYNVLAVIEISYYSGEDISPKSLIKGILTNPMIVGILAGFAYAVTGLPMPQVVDKSISYLGSISAPMALIMIGSRLCGIKLEGKKMAIAFISVIKLIISPLLFTGLAVYLGMPQEEVVSIFLLFGCPCAMNVYIMTRAMSGDDAVAAGGVFATFVGSVFTMSIGIFILRQLGIV